jgi:hypothetical protein
VLATCGTVVMLPYTDEVSVVERKLPALIRTWPHEAHELTCAQPGASWMFHANTLHWGRANTSLDQFRIVLNATLGSSFESSIDHTRVDSDRGPDAKPKRKRRALFTARSNRNGPTKKARSKAKQQQS